MINKSPMINISTYTMCALCAVPALVQTASAEESPNLDKFGDLLKAGIELSGEFIEVAKGLEEKTVSATDGAKAIDVLAVKAAGITSEMKELVASMSQEELQQVGVVMQDAELVEVLNQIGQIVVEAKQKLEASNHYDSPELKAACEKYFAASQ